MMMTVRQGRALAAVAALAFAVTACSGSSNVGAGVNTSINGKKGALSLGGGSATPTAAPAPAVPAAARPRAAATHPAAARPAATAAPRPAATQATSTFTITINGDNSGSTDFNPPQAAVYAGTVVSFVNHDTAARSVVARDGAFRSPSIPGGGTWRWTANAPGKHTYQDGTRPYAVGTLEVFAR